MSSDSSDEPLSSRCKRRKRTTSTSEDDTPIARRKRHRVIMDSDDESDSSVGPSTSRRSRNAIPLESDDASSDNESITDWATDVSDNEPETLQIAQTDALVPATVECQSDSSDGNSEKCPICLLSFSNQDIGTPETCEHLFCSDCITEWSKNVNTCPVDRLEFKTILVRRKIGGKVIKRIPVSSRTPSEDYLFQEDPTFCEVCESSGSEETMLLCDTCDLGFHMHCLRPPLDEVPENEWHCPRCLETDQPADEESRRRTNRSSEAASSRVTRTRRNWSVPSQGVADLEAPSTSQQQIARFAVAISSTVGARRSTSVRVQTRKKRKKRRATRAVIVEYELKDGEKFPVKKRRARIIRRRKKKKVKRRAPRTAARRNMVRSWVRGRLAQQINGTLLGADLAEARSSALTQPRFSIFGARDQLDYFPDSDEEDIETGLGNGSSAVAVAPRSSATAILDSLRQIRRKRVSIPSPVYASSAPDILSGILESQTLLHSKNASVSVRRDGTLNITVPHAKEGDKPKSDNLDRPNEVFRDIDNPKNSGEDKKIDVRDTDPDAVTKKAPAYPGSGRGGGGGGWRGGGGQRDYHGGGGGGGGNNYGRGSGGRNYSNDSYASGNSNYRDGGNFNSGGPPFQGDRSFSADNPWQNEGDFQSGRQQREREREREHYNPFPGRVLMPPRSGLDSGRSQPPPNRFNTPPGPLRPPPSWINRSLPDTAPFFRRNISDFPPPSSGYQAEVEQQNSDYIATGVVSDASQAEYLTVPAITGGDAPPQPPIIRFMKPPLSDDEQSDTGGDNEDKYDPTEPTLGDSGSEDEGPPSASVAGQPLTIVSPPRREPDLVADYGSGSESPVPVRVSPEVLDLAVQQVLREHRDLISGKSGPEDSEDVGADSDGDCPNFSIYSAASMGMVKNVSETLDDIPPPPSEPGDEDLVQEDDPSSPQGYLSPVRDEEHSKSHSEDENDDRSNESKAEAVDNEDDDLRQSDHNSEQTAKHDKEDVESEETEEKQVTRTPIRIVLTAPTIVQKSTLDLYDKDDVDDETASEPTGDIEKEPTLDVDCGVNEGVPEKDEDDDDDNDDSASAEVDPQIADVDKFTESISDAEDERSYTPCLDENKSTKSKDTTLESEKEAAGIEGLDTEMISDDEGNELFNDPNNPKNDSDGGALRPVAAESEPQPGEFEEGEIVEKGKLKIKEKVKALLERPEVEVSDDDKKKKKRKPDGKSKIKSKRGTESLGFKKLSKSGKERNYRERDDKAKAAKPKEKRRSRSAEKENKEKKDKSKDKKKEKRKDIERYDVRNVISDKSRRVKDVFGRDTSRPRSKSPDSRPGSRVGGSPIGRRSHSGPLRSVSRNRKSISKSRRSPSPRRTSSIAGRRSASRGRRTVSRGRKSLSRDRKSISPRFRRSASPRTRRSPSIRRRKSITPKRRSPSTRGRSPPNRGRRSISPRIRRSKSLRVRRSLSRGRNKRKRSPSRGRRLSPRLHRGKSPRRRPIRRSRSKLRSISRNRSRSPKNRKARKPKRNRSGSSKRKISRSPIKPKIKRKRSGSFSPGIVFSRSPSRERPIRQQWHQQQDKSPLYQDWTSGSQSMSPSALMSPGWTPPPVEKSPEPRNLRVILTTKDKTKKKEKKKKTVKRNKAAERVLKRHRPKETGPSKEVFTSGNNILVSVSFNKNQNGEDQPAMPPPEVVPKKKKRKGDPATKAKKDKNKDKTKKKRTDKNKRTKDLENKKPVAIIDLDRSPFKELTPSPKAVIVLSDSENGEKEEELMERQEMLREELMGMGFPHGDDSGSPPRSLVRENAYVSSAGPKTPPEPAVKFTIQSKSNPQLRAVNPLHEEEDETAEGEEADTRGQTENRATEVACKGPNTPPEPPDSPPSSPDAYDPFEPTKSGSATPERVSPPPPQADVEKPPEKRLELDLLQVPGMSMSLEAAQKSNLSADDVIQSRPISPREKVLALLKSTRNSLSPANATIPAFGDAIFDTSKPPEGDQGPATTAPTHSPDRLGASVAAVKPNSPKLIYSSVTPTVVTSTPVYPNLVAPRISAFGSGTPPSSQRTAAPTAQRTMLPSPAKSSPLKLQTTKLFLAKPSPIKSTPIKPMPAKSLISKLPLPSIKPMPARKVAKNPKAGQNGNEVIDLDMDMDSPYSPGSSDFGDLFEPPSDNGKHSSTAPSLYPPKQGKFDTFDSLFNVKSRSNNRSSTAKVTVRQMKKTKGKTQVGVKMDEDSLKILDDLPSSAVEMQVKTKFLKKLNRQERVVDEVKLVLKPHYNKKHVTKEEYKDILRRAVPKICHNRSGEINPAKIQALIEAYVRKFRKKAHQVK